MLTHIRSFDPKIETLTLFLVKDRIFHKKSIVIIF